MDLEPQIRSLIETQFLVDLSAIGVSGDENMVEAGIIDSFGLIELVGQLESTFGITLTDDDLLSPELVSLNGLKSMISRKQSEDQ